jgi:glycosyltransferase involved in cell wall biosynthesis
MEKMTGIDSAGFRRGVLASKRESQMLRHQYGLVGRVFVFAGRLDSGKGITYLIQALGLAQESLEGRASFLIIGDGEQRTDLESCATALARIPFHFTGFIQAEELPKWFALGDVFVLPTLDDNWPLVNLEAVAGGMRQLLSKFNGGSEDLATQVGIGDVFDPRDVEIFAQHLVLALEVDTTLDEETITDLLTTYSPESQAQRALASARTALARKTVFLQ